MFLHALMDELTHMSSQATKAGQYKVVVFDMEP